LLLLVAWAFYRAQDAQVNKRATRRVANMVDTVQAHCPEKIVAAMPWTRTRAWSPETFSGEGPPQDAAGERAEVAADLLPEQVFVAVGSGSTYAFAFAPKVSGFEIGRQVACWPRHEVSATAERANVVTYLTITTRAGESYRLETSTLTAAKARIVALFLEAWGVQRNDRLYVGY
jgi:hypothetical protein